MRDIYAASDNITFDGDFNLAIFASSPNVMYANTDYNMSISQTIYINIALFAKLNVRQFAFTFQFAKLNICQVYWVYGMCVVNYSVLMQYFSTSIKIM